MKTLIKLRVGKIRYLNCLPFHFGLTEMLQSRGWESEMSFFESYPAEINQAMERGEIDVAPVSSLEYLQHQNDYLLLPDLGIGTRLFARSVLLISKKKIEQLNGVVIALSRESLSSAGLVRILLAKKYNHRNTFELTDQDPEAMLQKYSAALVIGDAALFCQPKELIYKYDLGELWQSWTGKPFVFALWAVRKSFAVQHPEIVRIFCEVLKENLLKNLADPEALLKQALGIAPSDKKFCQLLGYLVNLQYTLDQDMKEGIVRFFELAHEEGLAPAPQPLQFFA
ncbi:MAG: menaquinone biosynthesis protein [Candidatus Omnitrophica bacterium]|nr:menaquinone biosynthesis protein [Candidatus Omnitrophota bacterium]